MPTLQVKIHSFSGFTRISVEGDHHPRRDITASGHCLINGELVFSPDHIWFWVDQQEGDDYKANIEIKWQERNLQLYLLKNSDGVKGDMAKVASPHFKGHIDALPPQVREDIANRSKSNPIYHLDDFSF
jgi:hypothetical protein